MNVLLYFRLKVWWLIYAIVVSFIFSGVQFMYTTSDVFAQFQQDMSEASQEILYTGNVDTSEIPEGIYNVTFRLYALREGGEPLWSGTYTKNKNNPIVVDQNGNYTVVLGSGLENKFQIPIRNNVYYVSTQFNKKKESTERFLIDTSAYNKAKIANTFAVNHPVAVSDLFCSVFGFVVNRFGWCVQIPNIITSASILNVPKFQKIPNQSSSTIAAFPMKNIKPVFTVSRKPGLSPEASYSQLTDNLLTYQSNGRYDSDKLLTRITKLEESVQEMTSATLLQTKPVSKRFVNYQTNLIYDNSATQIQSATKNITNSGTLTDVTFDGTITMSSRTAQSLLYTNTLGILTDASGLSIYNNSLTIGTTTPYEKLTIDGPVYLANASPVTTDNRLYNNNSILYWNGSAIASATSSDWIVTSGNIYRSTGNVGIGTTTPSRKLAVAGDAIITGALYDNSSSAGTNGYVLQTSGTGFTWVATSTLGLGASGATVSSVGLSAPTGFSVSGSPITSAGTLAISYAAGYEGLKTASSTNWNTFFDTPSTQISAGTGLTWTGNSLAADLGSSITAGEIANGDHGFFSYTGGVASLDTGGLTSADLSSALTDETGSGSVVFSTSPTFTGTTSASVLSLSGDATIAGVLTVAGITTLNDVLDVHGASSFATTSVNGNLIVNTSDLFVEAATGMIGIGTTTPKALLHLNGGVGSLATGLAFGSNGDTGIFENSDNILYFNLGGTTRWIMETSGFYTSTGSGPGFATSNAVVRPRYNDSDTGLTWNGSNSIGILAGGIQSLTADSSGNVGIGTTSPDAKLTVAGEINIDSSSSGISLLGTRIFYASTTNDSILIGKQTGRNLLNDGVLNTAVGMFALRSATSSDANTAFGFSALRDTSAGNNNTGVGAYALYLNTTGSENSAFGNNALYSNTTGLANSAFGRGALFANTTGNNNIAIGYSVLGSATSSIQNVVIGNFSGQDIANITSTGNNTFLGFNTGRGIVTGVNNTILGAKVSGLPSTLSNNIIIADGQGNRRINVDSFGYVGIGTTSPASKLDVWGDVRVGTSSIPSLFIDVANNQVRIGTTTTADTSSSLYVDGTLRSNQLLVENGNIGTNGIVFTNSANSGIEYQNNLLTFIHSNTNQYSVGNGYFESSAGNGSVRLKRNAGTASSPSFTFKGWNDTGLYAPADDTLSLVTLGTDRVHITSSGNVGIGTTTPVEKLTVIGNIHASGTVSASNLLGGSVNLTTDINGNIIRDPSDRRLKKNISPLEHALDKVLQLKGVTYQWKDTNRFGAQKEIGFIAQDLDLVLPEVVRKGGNYWSINTRNILAVVVEGMKEMWTTVTGNTEKINTLEARINTLEGQLRISTPEQNKNNIPTHESNIETVSVGNNPVDATASTTSDSPDTLASTTLNTLRTAGDSFIASTTSNLAPTKYDTGDEATLIEEDTQDISDTISMNADTVQTSVVQDTTDNVSEPTPIITLVDTPSSETVLSIDEVQP